MYRNWSLTARLTGPTAGLCRLRSPNSINTAAASQLSSPESFELEQSSYLTGWSSSAGSLLFYRS